MIYTLTLNPCLDYVLECENLLISETNRSRTESMTFGGKGINVSYVLKELGIQSKVLGFVGGFTGRELERLLRNMEIETDFVEVCGNTRINVKIKGKNITEINAAGFCVKDDDISRLYSKLDDLSQGDILVVGGSAPRGVSNNIYEDICKKMSDKKVKLVVDTTGEKLLNCLKYNPYLIKPNKSELCELFNDNIDDMDKIIFCARNLRKMGARNVIVSMADDGAVLVDENDAVHIVASHKIKTVNTVGAGDSMVAGFLAGVKEGFDYALKLGNACGGATAMSEGLAKINDIKGLLQ